MFCSPNRARAAHKAVSLCYFRAVALPLTLGLGFFPQFARGFDWADPPDPLVLPAPRGMQVELVPVFLKADDPVRGTTKFTMGMAEHSINESPTEVEVGGSFRKRRWGGAEWFFYMAKKEVTAGLFNAVMRAAGQPGKEFGGASDLPAVGLTWLEVQNFLDAYNRWLANKAGDLLPSDESGLKAFVRLPTEVEWEFAARGGSVVGAEAFGQKTPYGNQPLEQYEWFGGPTSSHNKLQPVGRLKPNPLGLHDMLGNATEMTSTPYQLKSGQGPTGGLVKRGGNFRTKAEEMRSSMRGEFNQYDIAGDRKGVSDLGFRIVVAGSIFSDADRLEELEKTLAQKQPWQKAEPQTNAGQQVPGVTNSQPASADSALTQTAAQVQGWLQTLANYLSSYWALATNSANAPTAPQGAKPPTPPSLFPVPTPLVTQQQPSEALALLRQEAEQGKPEALRSLGLMYAQGREVQKDDAEAVRLYRLAAEQGDAQAQTSLGWMHDQGRGVTADSSQAVSWFRRAAQNDFAPAQISLAIAYEQARGVARDDAQALRWLRKAAEQGDSALRWFRTAAEQGDAGAQFCLAKMLAQGWCGNRDEKQAVSWFRRAAEQGNAAAQQYLGFMYAEGRGVVKDDAEALRWFRTAAERGDSTAQLSLGAMFEQGRGVVKDDAEALRWFRMAAEQGNAAAEQYLRRMNAVASSSASDQDCARLRTFISEQEKSGRTQWQQYRSLVRRLESFATAPPERIALVQQIAEALTGVLANDLAIYNEMSRYPSCVADDTLKKLPSMIAETEASHAYLNGRQPLNGQFFDAQTGFWNGSYYPEYMTAIDFLKPPGDVPPRQAEPQQGPFYRPADKFPKNVRGIKVIGNFVTRILSTGQLYLQANEQVGERDKMRFFFPQNGNLSHADQSLVFTESNPLTVVRRTSFTGNFDVLLPE